MNKFSRLLTLGLVLVLLVGAFSIVGAQDEGKVLRARLGSTDVPSLDPALSTDSSSIQVLNLTYVGASVLEAETLDTLPGITTWEISENEDGTVTYTFDIIPEIPWVRYDAEAGEVVEVTDADGNVRYVTADDFVYGWKRTINPETAAEYSYVLYPQVVGGTDFANGEATADDVAIESTGEYTFEVTAPMFFGPQASIYGMWMARPQPQWAIEEYGEFWIEPENFQAYGPYTVKEWAHDESLTVIKNPFWPGTEAVPVPAIDEIEFLFLDQSVALSQFEAGDLDHMDEVPNVDIDRIKADPTLSEQFTITPSTCTYYYGFNTRDEPFNNVNLRKAFSYAVDRESLIDNVTKGGQLPGYWLTPPSMAGAPDPDVFMDTGVEYDPDLADEYMAAALEDLGLASVDELPPLTLLFNTSENHARIAEAIQQMWTDELGVEVQLTNQEFAVYLDSRENFPVWRAGWCQDYPDAHNFLFDVFHSSSQNNDTWWSNDEFDALLEEAMTMTDNEARAELYAEAEDILVKEEAAIIPIYWYTKLNMTADGVERTFALDNAEAYYNWDIVR